MQNARLDEAQGRIKIVRRNINYLRNADDTTLMAESKEELKSLFTKVKEFDKNSTFKKQRSWHLVPFHHVKKWANNGNSGLGLQKSLQMVTAAMKLKHTCSSEEKL